ncbi:MAG: ABC transporter permease [Planctomycetota bacterium]
MFRTALRMLFGDKTKCVGLVFGVMLTTLLMCQQISILIGLLNRAASVIDDAREAEIWVMDPSVTTIDVPFPLRETALPRVRGVEGVEWAVPFFKAGTQIRTREGRLDNGFIIGLDDATLIGVPDEFVLGSVEDLSLPDAIAINPAGYALLFPGEDVVLGKEIEINDSRAVVAGVVDVLPTFNSNLLIYTRYSRALEYTNNGRNAMSFILAKPSEADQVAEVSSRISESTDLKAVPSRSFRNESIGYILSNTGIPASFGTVVVLGVLVGVAIVGLTFNQFINENLRQYAALKAIGVGNWTLLRMTLLQAFFVAVVGYGLGLLAAAAFLAGASNAADGLAGFVLLPEIAIGVAILVALMVLASTVVSMRRVLVVDPATVFRG